MTKSKKVICGEIESIKLHKMPDSTKCITIYIKTIEDERVVFVAEPPIPKYYRATKEFVKDYLSLLADTLNPSYIYRKKKKMVKDEEIAKDRLIPAMIYTAKREEKRIRGLYGLPVLVHLVANENGDYTIVKEISTGDGCLFNHRSFSEHPAMKEKYFPHPDKLSNVDYV